MKMALLSLTAAFVVITAAVHSQTLRFVREADFSSAERFGSSVAAVGDVNGDGVDEFIVGSENYSLGLADRGIARLFDGRTGEVLFSRVGLSAGERLGAVVAGIGDVDQDGIPDFAIGAPRYDPFPALLDAGAVFVYSGNGTLLREFLGTAANMRYGSAITAVGDQNGDSLIDIAIGAPQAATNGANSGLIEVRSAVSFAVHFTMAGAAGHRLGAAVEAADIDGDGNLDIVGCATHANAHGSMTGRVTAYQYATGLPLGSIDGAAAGDQFGRTIENLGDQNGDGRDDLAIAAPFSDVVAADSGTVTIVSFLANQTLATILGQTADENFGTCISSGDIAGDGSREILIGGPGHFGQEGAAQGRLLIASTTGSTLRELFGKESGDEFGHACAFLPLGWSAPGMIVSAWREDSIVFGHTDYGAIYAYDFDAPELPILARFRPQDGGASGLSIIVPDLDGDGAADIATSEYFASNLPGQSSSGRVEIVSGKTGERIWLAKGAAEDRLGVNVAPIGDQNNDGKIEVAASDAIGRIHVLSGADGSEIGLIVDSENLGHYGRAICALDDLDGDGIREFAVTRAGVFLSPSGRLDVHHGGDFSLLWTISNSSPLFGAALDLIDDKNGDGKRDLIVGGVPTAVANPAGFNIQYSILSSVNGQLIATIVDPHYFNSPAIVGLNVVALGDVDQDGFGDFATGDTGTYARIFSGQTLTAIYPNEETGMVTSVGDVDQDGAADFYVAERIPTTLSGQPRVILFSGAAHGILAESAVTDLAFAVAATSANSANDTNGDGAGDVLLRSGPIPHLSGQIATSRTMSLVGAAKFAVGIDDDHVLDLSWQPIAISTGTIVASNAPSFAGGILGVSARRTRGLFADEVTLLPLDPSETLIAFFGYDATGSAAFFADLRQPSLAGQTLFLQMFAVDPSTASGLTSSNGLMVAFID